MVRTIGDENAWKKPVMRRGADVLSLLVTVDIAYKQIETFQAAMRHFKKETRSRFTCHTDEHSCARECTGAKRLSKNRASISTGTRC